MPDIRTFAPHEWKTYKDLRLRALAESPEAFGRTLAQDLELTDADWAARLAEGAGSGRDLPLLAEVDGEPAGLAWGRIDPAHPVVAHLYQMWVAPKYRGLGAGRMLLDTIIAWARAKGAAVLELGVTFRDSPAMHLYTRAGFEPAGEPEHIRGRAGLRGQLMRLTLSTLPAPSG